MSSITEIRPLPDPFDEDPRVNELVQRMLRQMDPFDGTDPNTVPVWSCKSCRKTEGQRGAHLRLCARCRLVYYCSTSCQKKDYKKHKKECAYLKSLTTHLKRHTSKLRRHRAVPTSSPAPVENLFQTSAGRFWDILATRDYCRTRCEIAVQIEDIAYNYEIAPLLNVSLTHRLELLRLNASDNLAIRNEVVFTFLRLNRDEDCYAFIKHWIRRHVHAEDRETIDYLHATSQPNDWIYGTADLYEDIFEAVPEYERKDANISFLMCICIIKLRIVAKHQADLKQMVHFRKTISARILGDSTAHVGARVVGGPEVAEQALRQEHLVQSYFDVIHEVNPTLLPSIINPGPLKSCPYPDTIQRGTASEAYGVHDNCLRLFARVPGAQMRLEDRFGENPVYDCRMHAD